MGYVICPVCKQHYMLRDSPHDRCKWCRGMPYAGRRNKTSQHHIPKHPCSNRAAMQRCHRDGKVFVCGRSARAACQCDHFQKREAATS
jgi:hypothetical protein